MGEKTTCPGCHSHTSNIWHAFRAGESCPHCGLSSSAALEVAVVQQSRADESLREQTAGLVIECDRLRGRAEVAESKVRRMSAILTEDSTSDKAGSSGETGDE